ncbi:hypothetical protein ET495_12690 [Xylanimonas allomyrinae]|uniref:Uncharacterized protein n=1 Tax=Xylanimonas allomyrinae TaxID=2509459 RepID=A0A4V0YEE6_9MICO|nr:hypothetical protein [Xylanimonas allomyrinae]QAY63941.1 hypothetical protein ET495_12690 [Xylanimonas allomyrinae]
MDLSDPLGAEAPLPRTLLDAFPEAFPEAFPDAFPTASSGALSWVNSARSVSDPADRETVTSGGSPVKPAGATTRTDPEMAASLVISKMRGVGDAGVSSFSPSNTDQAAGRPDSR